jgi:8-oxo-dGTP pyrophosphatase MutT (NUDIX family)
MNFKQFLEADHSHAREFARSGFWGKQGAGVIFYASDTGRYLIAHRSPDVLEPNTWGTWGGAVNEGETAREAARREVEEETGHSGNFELEELWTYRDERSGFRYTNFLAIVPSEFKPKLDWETQGYRWVKPGEWPKPLHFGLKALLQHVSLD